jgi:hypothetical protein
LRLGTFFILDVLELGRFESWDILKLGRFVLKLGRFAAGTVCLGTFCIWDILQLGRYVLARFVCEPIQHLDRSMIVW